MPKTSAAPRAATLKQAKAAFKARGNPVLSEREKKQLQRSIDLDKRAFAAREREKRKAEAARDKSEKERKKKDAVEQVRLGTQRRRDKFGYASSQFHLGAFFGKSAVEHADNKENPSAKPEAAESDLFGEDDVDDESLLEALGSPACDSRSGLTTRSDSAAMPPPARPLELKCHNIHAQEPSFEDFESFFDELGSSTQIARELDQPLLAQAQSSRALTNAELFGSVDFDMSTEDIAELDRTSTEVAKRELDRKIMPPPALPVAVKPPIIAKMPPVRTHSTSSDKSHSSNSKPPRLSRKELDKRALKDLEAADEHERYDRGFQYALPASVMNALPPGWPRARKTTKVYSSSRTGRQPDLFSNARGFRGMMPRPTISVRKPSDEAAPSKHPCTRQQQATSLSGQPRVPLRAADTGFSLAQLEDFVDDDLQLTQIEPG